MLEYISLRQSSFRAFFAGVALSLVLTLFYFFLLAPQRSFPMIPDGNYMGRIAWDESHFNGLPRIFLLEKRGDEYTIMIPGPERKTITGIFSPTTDEPIPRYLPLQVSTQKSHFLWFSSEEYDSRRAVLSMNGEVFERRLGALGRWTLRPIDFETRAQMGAPEKFVEEKALLLEVSLLLEEKTLSENLDYEQLSLRQREEEVRLLEEQVTSPESLRAEGMARIQQLASKLTDQKSMQFEATKKLHEVANQLSFARGVRDYGEVIELSRKLRMLEEEIILAEEGGFFTMTLPSAHHVMPDEEHGRPASSIQMIEGGQG